MRIFNIIESFINLSPIYENLLRTSTNKEQIDRVDKELSNLYHRYRALLDDMTTSEIVALRTKIIEKTNELEIKQTKNEDEKLQLEYYKYYVGELESKSENKKRI